MKLIFTCICILVMLSLNSQVNVSSSLKFNGALNGGTLIRSDLPATPNQILHHFNKLQPHAASGPLVDGDDPWLYGTLEFNGNNQNGSVFRIREDGTGFEVIRVKSNSSANTHTPFFLNDKLYISTWDSIIVRDVLTMGSTSFILPEPNIANFLLVDADEWIYFTSVSKLHRIKPDGSLHSVLHNFDLNTQGNNPDLGVIEGPGTKLFGTTSVGGTNNLGTIFSINKDGTGFTVHHHFQNSSGYDAASRLVHFDGKIFGTTSQGGSNGYGSFFVINDDGTNFRVNYHYTEGSTPGIAFPEGNIHITTNGRVFGTFSQFYASGFSYFRCYKMDTAGTDFTPLHNLNQAEHGNENKGVMFLDDINFFIITRSMGRHEGGVINSADTSGSITSLHPLGQSPLGFYPNPTIQGFDGKIYGTTVGGGDFGNGTAFRINMDGTGFERTHNFTDVQGKDINGPLLKGSDTKFYGVCRQGGPINGGILFRLNADGEGYQMIYSSASIGDGYWPVGPLVEDAGGKLYGVNQYSSPGNGNVFRVNKDGTGFQILHSFTSAGINSPFAGVIIHGGVVYGTCIFGGAGSRGGIFRMDLDGSNYSTMHEFNGVDGSQAGAPLFVASNGKIYGSTSYGGNNGGGTLFRIETNGTGYILLHHLDPNINGANPQSSLFQGSDGLLYGSLGYSNVAGSLGGLLFSMDADGNNFTIRRTFDGGAEGYLVTGASSFTPGSALPLTLLRFTGKPENNHVLLNWQTIQEQNTSHFIVERSADGNSYRSLGQLNAAGYSTDLRSYSFTDMFPGTGWNYYRLKMVDRDGKFLYSNAIRISFRQAQPFLVYPNPATTHLQVQWSPADEAERISIFSMDGRLLFRKFLDGNQYHENISLHFLPAGNYILKLEGRQPRETLFIKQ